MSEKIKVVLVCTDVAIDDIDEGSEYVTPDLISVLLDNTLEVSLEDFYKLKLTLRKYCDKLNKTIVITSTKGDLVQRDIFDQSYLYQAGSIY